MKKILLITGGGRGIGAATSLAAAREGYAICINYHKDKASAENIARQIESTGGTARLFCADISNECEVEKMFSEIDSEFGRITALVNNAGIIPEQSDLMHMSYDRIDETFRTNVVGTFLCSREVLKRMSTLQGGQGGVIINVSSGASKTGSPNEYIDYAATKGAIDTFTVGLAREVAKQGIRVNAVRPGFINTGMHNIPNRLEEVKQIIPFGRVGTPEEVASGILWLLSDKASYVSGAILDIAGGK